MSQPHQPADLQQGKRFEVTGDQYQPSLIILDHDWWQANEMRYMNGWPHTYPTVLIIILDPCLTLAIPASV